MSKKSWDVVDPCPFGDVDEDAIFREIGRALTEWETVEVECAKLFAVFVASRHKYQYHAPAVRAYGSIPSASSRHKMLQFAAESYFAKRPAKRASFERKCNDAINEYNLFSARRNEIAHGLVKRIFIAKNGKRHELRGIYLLPSFFNPRKFKKGELAYLYVSGDITHYKQEFAKLALKIGGLSQQLAQLPSR